MDSPPITNDRTKEQERAELHRTIWLRHYTSDERLQIASCLSALLLVRKLCRAGLKKRRAFEIAEVQSNTYYRWLANYKEGSLAALRYKNRAHHNPPPRTTRTAAASLRNSAGNGTSPCISSRRNRPSTTARWKTPTPPCTAHCLFRNNIVLMFPGLTRHWRTLRTSIMTAPSSPFPPLMNRESCITIPRTSILELFINRLMRTPRKIPYMCVTRSKFGIAARFLL